MVAQFLKSDSLKTPMADQLANTFWKTFGRFHNHRIKYIKNTNKIEKIAFIIFRSICNMQEKLFIQ